MSSSIEKANNASLETYFEQNHDRFLEELMMFLRFPSISTKASSKPDIIDCANWLVRNMNDAGIESKIIETESNPLVYGQWLGAGADAPTVLVYGHYDVQPEDPIDLWHSKPFEPEIRNGKIWGRGTADDKGQVFTHIKAAEAHLKTFGKLPVNLKFIIEGEEESGGEAIEAFLYNHADQISCDTVMISDTEWFAQGLPSITYSLRGIAVVQLNVWGPNRDLHSGTYGGAVANPVNELCKIIAAMHDENGKITIPGFYDNVLELSAEERQEFAALPFDLEKYKEDLAVKELSGEKGFSTLEKVWARPTLDLNGMFGGYIEEGHKSIIPSYAHAKISMRLVPNQEPEEIIEKFTKYVKTLVPDSIKVEVVNHHGGNPVIVSKKSKGVEAAKIALERAFSAKSVFMREGGSIPIVGLFEEKLNAPVVLMGLGLDTDNIHSPNENMDLDNFFGGIKASAYFLEEMAK